MWLGTKSSSPPGMMLARPAECASVRRHASSASHPDRTLRQVRLRPVAGVSRVRIAWHGNLPTISSGDFFEIPPGHDAYVDGPDPVELILFAPPEAGHRPGPLALSCSRMSDQSRTSAAWK